MSMLSVASTITDKAMQEARNSSWLLHEVRHQLVQQFARQVLELYVNSIRGERLLTDWNTMFRLDLYVFTDEELESLIQYRIREHNQGCLKEVPAL